MNDVFGLNFKEASTWRSLVVLASYLGYEFAPDEQNAIIGAGVAVFTLLGVLTKRQGNVS